MHRPIGVVPAFALALALGACSSMGQSDHQGSGPDGMHRAEASETAPDNGDSAANCAPDRIGAAAGQGSDCRHGTGGATSTPPDSSNSNDPKAPTTPPR
jgi:hypothetical protein